MDENSHNNRLNVKNASKEVYKLGKGVMTLEQSMRKSKRHVKERENNWRQGKIGIELQNSRQHLHFHYEEIALGK